MIICLFCIRFDFESIRTDEKQMKNRSRAS